MKLGRLKDLQAYACFILYLLLSLADANGLFKAPAHLLEMIAAAGGWGLKAKFTRRQ